MMNRTLLAAALSLACAGAFAQATTASTVQRDVNQQTRIETGLRDGSLTNREVSKLERGQAHVDAKEPRPARDGHVTKAEQASVQRAENPPEQAHPPREARRASAWLKRRSANAESPAAMALAFLTTSAPACSACSQARCHSFT